VLGLALVSLLRLPTPFALVFLFILMGVGMMTIHCYVCVYVCVWFVYLLVCVHVCVVVLFVCCFLCVRAFVVLGVVCAFSFIYIYIYIYFDTALLAYKGSSNKIVLSSLGEYSGICKIS